MKFLKKQTILVHVKTELGYNPHVAAQTALFRMLPSAHSLNYLTEVSSGAVKSHQPVTVTATAVATTTIAAIATFAQHTASHRNRLHTDSFS